ncbi:MAG: hypothetical protein A2X48_10805 [Lentisphaerae bacterium GWF2_49_21]|nr:MAG: hypothetical protein A2X48_10805 [Lentisphaerae bacterium GWF2_49_21]
MPIYEEKRQGKRKCVLILIAAFFVLYMPFQLGERELRWDEVYYAPMALEMNLLNPNTIAHGEVISSNYPMYPWMVSILYDIGASPEFGLRLVSVLSILAMSVIAWEAGRRAVGIQTAVVSTSLLISSIIMIDKGVDGYPDMLGLLFILSGWIAWFTYGPARGNWNRAWLVSFFFCGLAFYTIGWKGVFIFGLPLIFMRRPMTIWSRLNKPGLFLGVAILVFFILIWGIPRWLAGADIPFRNIPFKPDDFLDYLGHIFFFPFEFFLRSLPLSIFAWPAFCAAYTPLDRNPVFSRFLKTITVSVFFFLWLYPFADPRDYVILVPPLAILAGMNYWLMVRRLGFQTHHLLKILDMAGIACAVLALLFYTVPTKLWSAILMKSMLSQLVQLDKLLGFRQENLVIGICFAGISILILAMSIRNSPRKYPAWLHALSLTCAMSLLFWSVIYPYQTYEKRQRQLARQIREAMGEDFRSSMTIYKESNIPLYSLCTYLQCARRSSFPPLYNYEKIKIKKIDNVKELQEINGEIYIFSDEYPIPVGRPPHTRKIPVNEEKNIFLWKFPAAEAGGAVK